MVREKQLLTERPRGVSKAELRGREEAAIKAVISDLLDQNGGYPRPEVSRVLWLQILRLPLTLYTALTFWSCWVWRFYLRQISPLQIRDSVRETTCCCRQLS